MDDVLDVTFKEKNRRGPGRARRFKWGWGNASHRNQYRRPAPRGLWSGANSLQIALVGCGTA